MPSYAVKLDAGDVHVDYNRAIQNRRAPFKSSECWIVGFCTICEFDRMAGPRPFLYGTTVNI